MVVKEFLVNLGINYALGVVRGWLNNAIGKFTPDELYTAVIENQDLWAHTPEDMRETGRKFKKTWGGIFEKHMDRVDTELILQWIKEDQFPLYSTLININIDGQPRGIMWMDMQVNKIKAKIMEM